MDQRYHVKLMNNLYKIGGSMFFISGSQFIIGMIVAESLYPGYSTSINTISDLGATCKSNCIIHQSSSIIFNSSAILLGGLAFVGSYIIFRHHRTLPIIFMMIASWGAIGVGLFPETTRFLHIIVAGIDFFFTGLASVTSYRLSNFPMSCFSVVLGVSVLLMFFLLASNNFFKLGYLGLGQGGLERAIVYPGIIWLIGIGSHLIGRTDKH